VRKECALRFVVKFHCAMKGSADFVLPSRDRRVMSDAPLTLIAEPEGEAATDQTRRAPDAGLLGLVMLARFHNIAADADQLAHDFREPGRQFGVPQILLAARQIGLKAKQVATDAARLAQTPLPALAIENDGSFVILARVDEQQVLIQDPRVERPQVLSLAEFEARWNGQLILFASRASLAGELAKFDFTWFIPAVVKYRKLLGEVLLVSFVLQLFALATPLFFQVVMDKVLVHRGMSTLDVMAVGLLVVSLFEVALSGLRTYVFAHTTSRIDVELGARLFRHLLNLPLAYFQARRVGDTVARVRELENIRQFLTGNAITLVLDLLFSVVFIAVMFYYSPLLTLVVVLSLPCYLGLSLAITPLLRARLNEKFNRGAENQSFLVETINGIDTVKAMAVEPQMTRRWDNQLAGYVAAGFRTASLGTIAHEGVNLIGKLVTIVTLWLGARLVMEGQLSMGQLIAFNMLAGRVATPVMRLAQLWTDFQQTGLSVQRLGDILNAKTETAGGAAGTAKGALPPIAGPH
jgi:subfamily B ATP-binding cassette protein HlyB/CyaB